MKNLYQIQCPEGFKYALLLNSDVCLSQFAHVNKALFSQHWLTALYKWHKSKKNTVSPEISTTGFPSVGFKAPYAPALFPTPNAGIELLPLTVEDEPWLLINCLNLAHGFDEARSEFKRLPYMADAPQLEGEISQVIHVVLTDLKALDYELFLVDGLPRQYLYCTQSFVDRVTALGLQGVYFKAVGRIADPATLASEPPEPRTQRQIDMAAHYAYFEALKNPPPPPIYTDTPLTTEQRNELDIASALGLLVLGLSNQPATKASVESLGAVDSATSAPAHIQQTLFEQLPLLRKAFKNPPEQARTLSAQLGAVWASTLVTQLNWEWVQLSEVQDKTEETVKADSNPSDTQDGKTNHNTNTVSSTSSAPTLALVSPDRKYRVEPFSYLHTQLSTPRKTPTTALLFNMIAAGNLPSAQDKQYRHLS